MNRTVIIIVIIFIVALASIIRYLHDKNTELEIKVADKTAVQMADSALIANLTKTNNELLIFQGLILAGDTIAYIRKVDQMFADYFRREKLRLLDVKEREIKNMDPKVFDYWMRERYLQRLDSILLRTP